MSQVFSKGKYPKEPRVGNFLEICQKDFDDFKKHDYKSIFRYLSMLVTVYENRGFNSEVIQRQKQNLEQIKQLIDQGKANEQVAFVNFFRSFPSCLPHRELLL
jgi:hypothetical protein